MLRIVFGIFAGFAAWVFLWFGIETILSVLWREFGAHQAAFQTAIEYGGPFKPDTTILLIHVVIASIVSLISGYLAAVIAGTNRHAPFVLGFLLVVLGLQKASMSWPLVPIWYNIAFTAILPVMTIIGGKLRETK